MLELIGHLLCLFVDSYRERMKEKVCELRRKKKKKKKDWEQPIEGDY